MVDHEKLYEFETANLSKLKISGIFRELIELLYRLIIRIRDLLHLTYAYMLSKTHGVKYFLIRDIGDFEKVKDKVRWLLQIE